MIEKNATFCLSAFSFGAHNNVYQARKENNEVVFSQ